MTSKNILWWNPFSFLHLSILSYWYITFQKKKYKMNQSNTCITQYHGWKWQSNAHIPVQQVPKIQTRVKKSGGQAATWVCVRGVLDFHRNPDAIQWMFDWMSDACIFFCWNYNRSPWYLMSVFHLYVDMKLFTESNCGVEKRMVVCFMTSETKSDWIDWSRENLISLEELVTIL